jgi:hypothetical protein
MSDGANGPETDEDDGYSGVLGTFPYAFRRSDSPLLRSYVVIGGLLAVLVAVVFSAALIQLLAGSAGGGSGSFSFVRSFFILIGMAIVVPLMAPVLLVARRHRRTGSTRVYDQALAAAGYLFVFSLYLALVITAPPALRDDPSGALEPVVSFLYGLPTLAGAVPPLIALAVGYALHRRYR